jgi:hypothetical protein
MGEQPPGCQGSGSIVTLTLLPAQAAYAVGQQVRFLVVLENPALQNNGLANCNISKASVSFTRPDGMVVQVVNNQTLAAGANAIVCPGDPGCASPSSSFDYVIREDDLHLINPAACPAAPGSIPAFTASVYRQCTVESGIFGTGFNESICYNSAVTKSCITGTATFTNSGGQDPEIKFTGSIVNCSQTPGFLGGLQGVAIYQVANGTTNTVMTGISLTNGEAIAFNGSFTSTSTKLICTGELFHLCIGF